MTEGKSFGVLSFKDYSAKLPLANQLILSKNGDLKEAATNLFAAMRELDSMDLDYILAEPVPNIGLGKAINDRLNRAAA